MLTVYQLQKWRKKNQFYYQDLEKFYQFWVQPNMQVLELGSGFGDILNAVKPKRGISIGTNPSVIEASQLQYNNLEFILDDIENFQKDMTFDYILLPNTISHVGNIQNLLKSCYNVSTLSTRVILTFHNPAWEIILQLATLLRQRMSIPELNWLSLEDIRNILDLENFEIITHGKRCLLPKDIPFVSAIVNKFIAPLPIFNQMCLTEYVIARPRQQPSPLPKDKLNKLTCSVLIPARNEAGNIASCMTRMPRLGKLTEIIFVEGHSTDETWREIQVIQKQYDQDWSIKAIQQTGRGKGNAIREACEIAEGDILIILDSDLTVQPEDLTYFFNAVAFNHCDFANGCRLVYPLTKETMPWLNIMANRFFAWLLSFLLNTKIKDSLCGTKAFRKIDYQRISDNRQYFGDFDPFGDFDLLFGAAKLGLKIQDIPIKYMPRTYGKSNIRHFKEGLELFKMCLYAAAKIKFI